MALNWQWNDKMGTAKHVEGYTLNLYKGNAFVIAIYEWQDGEKDLYNIHWFAVSEDHMKNMLGLNKGYDNCFKDFEIEEIRLDVNYKETAKLVQMFAKAKLEIKIELYEGRTKK